MARTSIDRQRYYWLLVSPLLSYALAFLAVLLLYGLDWSLLYLQLSLEVVIFIVSTIMVCLVIASMQAILTLAEPPWRGTWWNPKRARITLLLIYLVVGAEFIAAGGVPIILMATGEIYDYRNFGIPTLHVVAFGIYNFLAVHWFSLWLRLADRRYLTYSTSLLLINLLIVNRGAVVQCLLAMGVLFVLRRGLGKKTLAAIVATFAIGTYSFGLIGDSRMQAMGMDPETTISVIGDASGNYPGSILGTGPFWVYLYASSPLANLQLNVSQNTTVHADVRTFSVLELVPDFIAKRLVSEDLLGTSPTLITPAMTVTSAYGRAYYLSGWLGCVAVFMLFIAYYALVRFIFSGTEYLGSALATMSAGASLLTYYNMLTFAGFVGPMLVAALLRFTCIRKSRLTRRTTKGNAQWTTPKRHES